MVISLLNLISKCTQFFRQLHFINNGEHHIKQDFDGSTEVLAKSKYLKGLFIKFDFLN